MKTSKDIRVLLLFLLFVAGGLMALTSCNDTEDGSYVAPITLGEKVNGKWVLNSITQIDEVAGTESLNLTGLFDFRTFSITLNADADNRPTGFSVEGQAPALLPLQGTWDINTFTHSDGKANQITLKGSDRTVVLTLTATPGANRVLELKMTRRQKGQAFVSYVYNLIPASAEQ